MQQKFLLSLIATALIVGGGAFYGGMQYQKSQGRAGQAQFANRAGGRVAFGGGAGTPGAPGRVGGAGFTGGEVISKDANSLTVKSRDGGSKVVFYSTSTKVGKMTDGSLDDLSNGTNITVTGTPNQDGSVTASMIQIRPAGDPVFFGRGATSTQ